MSGATPPFHLHALTVSTGTCIPSLIPKLNAAILNKLVRFEVFKADIFGYLHTLIMWVTVKFLLIKVLCTLGCPYTEGTCLYYDYFF